MIKAIIKIAILSCKQINDVIDWYQPQILSKFLQTRIDQMFQMLKNRMKSQNYYDYKYLGYHLNLLNFVALSKSFTSDMFLVYYFNRF
jgi:hypothetical protein